MSADASDYEARLSIGIFRAIAIASAVEADGQTKIVVMCEDAVRVLQSNIALLIAKSDRCSSPAKTRKYCDEFARKLQRAIAAAQASDPPFIHAAKMGVVH